MRSVTQMPAWGALQEHFEATRAADMAAMFGQNPARAAHLSFEAAGVFLDLSKNRLTPATIGLLIDLARERNLGPAMQAMFGGEKINLTENRAVLHVALRASGRRIVVDGEDVVPLVAQQRARMAAIVDAVRDGQWLGHSGKPIKTVVHIGIGGSDLGPRMVTNALWPYHHERVEVRFVANLDGSDISRALDGLDPLETLFIIASKTFTTAETMANAHTARRWLLAAAGDEQAVARHFVALSANLTATSQFGIDNDNVLSFWDWVGGRFSLWSVIGMPIAIAIGNQRFDELLAGARAMDEHFERSPFEQNLPVLLGLVGIWYRNFFGCGSHAILPYDDGLAYLPNYLQQAEMESNGKSVRCDGEPVGVSTAPVIWGGVGSNAQHAFFQLLHQGTDWVPADFIAALSPQHDLAAHHEGLLANCFAQTQALLQGDREARDSHRRFNGNRPSTTILVDKLTPRRLGALIALYEHKIFVQGQIWGINSFDQFGVELGKRLATRLAPALAGAASDKFDASTTALIRRYQAAKKNT